MSTRNSGTNGTNGNLSAKQRALLMALLAGAKTDDAAKSANISKRTAYRWQQEPTFQQAMRNEQDKAFEKKLVFLKEGFSTALYALMRNMGEKAPPGVQVAAARCWIETTFLVHRSEQLETAMEAMQEQIQAQMAELKAMEGGLYA